MANKQGKNSNKYPQFTSTTYAQIIPTNQPQPYVPVVQHVQPNHGMPQPNYYPVPMTVVSPPGSYFFEIISSLKFKFD